MHQSRKEQGEEPDQRAHSGLRCYRLYLDDARNVTRSFDERIEDLKEYKWTHGHLNVKIHEDNSLYQFCAGVRHSLKQFEKDGTRKLMEERIQRRDALGFEWGNALEASDDAAPEHEK